MRKLHPLKKENQTKTLWFSENLYYSATSQKEMASPSQRYMEPPLWNNVWSFAAFCGSSCPAASLSVKDLFVSPPRPIPPQQWTDRFACLEAEKGSKALSLQKRSSRWWDILVSSPLGGCIWVFFDPLGLGRTWLHGGAVSALELHRCRLPTMLPAVKVAGCLEYLGKTQLPSQQKQK